MDSSTDPSTVGVSHREAAMRAARSRLSVSCSASADMILVDAEDAYTNVVTLLF